MSLSRLGTCDEKIQKLIQAVSKEEAIVVICGFRNKQDQDKAVHDGNSKTPWPTSRHNVYPSEAIDIAPVPINWNDIAAFKRLAKVMFATAEKMGIEIEWGGDWAMRDYVHFQLKAVKEKSLELGK